MLTVGIHRQRMRETLGERQFQAVQQGRALAAVDR